MENQSISMEKFVLQTLQLLQKERDAEIEETKLLTDKLSSKELQRRGVCVLKLHISSRRIGLYGRVVVVLETHQETLPSHSLTPGDIVSLNHSSSDNQSEALGSGLVTRVSQSAISVAFDDTTGIFSLEDGSSDFFKLTKLASDVTYKRLKKTLDKLNKGRHEETGLLIPVLFGEQQPSTPYDIQDIAFVNGNLDGSQREAVRFSLSQREVAVVHGPPGTGKTTTVIEIILQAVKQGQKILACAPSNIAVDNLVERLSVSKHRIVRLGHPARLLPHIQKYSLDAILSASDEKGIVEDVRADLNKAIGRLKTVRNAGEKQKLREDMKYLRKELRQRENAATRAILKRADVVLVTLTSATDDGPMKLLEASHFDVVVIDEVSQAMEAACWIPLLRTRKCILAGDHLQLPPTILSKEAAKAGLAWTLMERVLALHGDGVMRMLTTQYRMNQKIMQWSSDQLYESKLVAHHSIHDHLLRDLPGVTDDEVSCLPLLFIDTAGCEMNELELPEEISKGNEGEADIVAAHVARLIVSGVKQEDIAVIAPYNLQVELIRLRLGPQYPKVEVKSVDGFQGREKEAVVISLVRSNSKGEVGFLSERRRINVAVTRARRHLAVVGDSVTVSNDVFLKSLIDYLNTEGEVHTAQEYKDGVLLNQTDITRPEHLDDLMSIPRVTVNRGARPKESKPQGNKPDNRQGKEKRKNDTVTGQVTQEPRNSSVTDTTVEDPKIHELQKELDSFMLNGQADILEFPTSLNSHDRLIVHELSEKMGLAHVSKGVGNDRYLVVSKPANRSSGSSNSVQSQYSLRTDITQTKPKVSNADKQKNNTRNIGNKDMDKNLLTDDNVSTNTAEQTQDKQPEINPKNSGQVQCTICGKDVNKSNIQLHELHCAKRGNQKQTEGIRNDKHPKPVSKSAKPRQFDKELAKRVDNVDKDDIDALIATVQQMDKFCCFKKCKTSVQTLFQLCKHCEGRYCMSHQTPEVHGCGDAARASARAQIGKDGVLYRGSGTPNRKADPAKKANLHRRLDSKLSEMSDKRKSKPKK